MIERDSYSQLKQKYEVLEADKVMLESEVELHRNVTKNSAEIVHIMTSFFSKSFKEISRYGFDLLKLKTVQSVLEEAHISSLLT